MVHSAAAFRDVPIGTIKLVSLEANLGVCVWGGGGGGGV